MKNTFACIAAAMTFGTFSAPALAGDTPWVGEITTVGFNFCPRGWAKADGALLPIASNNALFSLFGTIYGGDGRTNFALPDLRGRTGIHAGHGPGLTNRKLGSRVGAEAVTLSVAQMPAHSHTATSTATGSNVPAGSPDPSGASPALSVAGNIYNAGVGTVDMATGGVKTTIGSAGGNQSHPNMQPSLTLMYCVALVGTYPSRN